MTWGWNCGIGLRFVTICLTGLLEGCRCTMLRNSSPILGPGPSQGDTGMSSTPMENVAKKLSSVPTSTRAHVAEVTIPCTQVRPRANLPSSVLNQIQRVEQGLDLPTPIKWQEFDSMLKGYDTEKRRYVIQGLRFGFKLGYRGSTCVHYTKNVATVRNNLGATSELIDKELKLGRFMGPFKQVPFDHLHLSPIAIKPKKAEGSFHMVMDLSAPYTSDSINF